MFSSARLTRPMLARFRKRSFAKEAKQAFQPPPDAPSGNSSRALWIGALGCGTLLYLFNMDRNDYGISWYADDKTDDSKVPAPRPSEK